MASVISGYAISEYPKSTFSVRTTASSVASTHSSSCLVTYMACFYV